MFRTNVPVTARHFLDREEELGRLQRVVGALAAGAPRWLAILGPRKVGKTSLLLELARRNAGRDVRFVVLDLNLHAPLHIDVFRRYALRASDALFAGELDTSLEAAADARPARLTAALTASSAVAGLPAELRRELHELGERVQDPARIGRLLDLPAKLASALGRRLLVALDEFQLLGGLRHGTRSFEPFPRMRAVWQRHEDVAYVISGSAPTMLRDLVTSERSPFFQHFELMELGPMSREDALLLLVRGSEGSLPATVRARVVDLVGGHPFYVQLLGEELLDAGPPFDDKGFKDAVQRLLFSRTGRLSLYFQREYDRTVGRAATLAAAVDALASAGVEGLSLSEIARVIGSATGPTARYLARLGDVATRVPGERWALADPTFALWIRWRHPAGRAVPMAVVGDEAERAVAAELAAAGFDLVYQSRASRGAFDLLALRGPVQVGVQVKRRALPLTFRLPEWRRMEAEAGRLGWRWLIAAVARDGGVTWLDPVRARVKRTARLHDEAAIDNVLGWIDG